MPFAGRGEDGEGAELMGRSSKHGEHIYIYISIIIYKYIVCIYDIYDIYIYDIYVHIYIYVHIIFELENRYGYRATKQHTLPHFPASAVGEETSRRVS